MGSRGFTFVQSVIVIAVIAVVAAPAAMGANDIAYRCNNNDVCLIDPDNPAGKVNLTFNDSASGDAYPFWSPDGSKVGFTSNFGTGPGIENLFTMNPSAPGQTINGAVQLTHYSSSAAAVRGAVWSPDGSKVAYNYEAGGSSGVYVVNADGSSATPTTISAISTQATDPTFSPDGTKIAYSIGQQVYIENADGSSAAPQTLTNGQCHSPKWSPDGTRIACDYPKPFSQVDVHIVNVDGTGTPVVLTSTAQFSFAAWSPDGTRIAYRDTHDGGVGYYRVANADGTGDHALPMPASLNENAPASWSPDGSRLTFSAFYFGDGSTQADDTTEVYVTNSDGSGATTAITSGGVSLPVNAGNADAVWKPGAKAVSPPVQPPLAGPTIKPKVVWITKRIPYSEGPYVQGPAISCPSGSSDARCVAAAAANHGGARGPAIRMRLAGKPKSVLVAKGKVTIAPGKTKRLKLKLTKAGKKLLLKRKALKLQATVKITVPGQKATVSHHVMRVYVKKKK